MMPPRLLRATLAAACLAASVPLTAQTIVGPDSEASRFNRLRDLSVRHVLAVPPASPDVFGTVAIGAGVTFYDARFRRVSSTDRAHPLVVALAQGLHGQTREQQLATVQREVRARVRWASDLDTMKVADLWANAGETLERGAGDSEDIAVVEMQALKLAGWSPRDLYISIGREKSVGAHVVLLARAPSGFYVLDDRAARPMTTQQHGKSTPVLTLGEGKSWVHGRRVSGGGARLSAR
jgi:predicted transglutaminase-like cysteine proteinase